jgi:flagellin
MRLINAGISPGDIAISSSFRAQIGGTEQAIYNSQDAINLAQTADATLGGQTETLLRMRDLAVRAGNEATLTPEDRARLNQEYQSLNNQLTQTGEAASFNSKQLTSAVNPYNTQAVQSQPNNNPAANESVTINPSTAATLGTTVSDLTTPANAQNAINTIDNALANVSNQRANLGVTSNNLNYTTNALESSRINMMAANSRIAELNMEEGITNFSKGLLLNKFGLAALSATNAQQGGVLKLLGVG